MASRDLFYNWVDIKLLVSVFVFSAMRANVAGELGGRLVNLYTFIVFEYLFPIIRWCFVFMYLCTTFVSWFEWQLHIGPSICHGRIADYGAPRIYSRRLGFVRRVVAVSCSALKGY